MLTKGDLAKIGEVSLSVVRGVIREEVVPRLDSLEARAERTERGVAEVSRGLASVEFRLADVQDQVDTVAKGVNRIERRLDAARIPHLPEPDGGAMDGPWLQPSRPSGS